MGSWGDIFIEQQHRPMRRFDGSDALWQDRLEMGGENGFYVIAPVSDRFC